MASTPKAATPSKNAAFGTDSPGGWRHPRLAEIERRRAAATFSETNVRTIVANVCALLAVWAANTVLGTWGPHIEKNHPIRTYLGWGNVVVQLIPVFNIFMALKPFWGRPDDLSDIPLTPAQRALLGLGPSSVPPTPDTVYSTPPRYSRTPSLAGSLPNSVTSTPGSAGSTSMGVIGGGGGVGGGGGGAGGAGARYSPMAAAATSPLLQKAMAGGMTRRRSSIGSQGLSGAGAGSGVGGVGLPGLDGGAGATTSPSAGKRSSVTLNSKWLYEKGRRSSGSSWLH